MTEAVQIACVVAVPPTLVAIAGLIQSMRNGKKSDQIHVLVNSNLTAVKADLDLANQRIAGLMAKLEHPPSV